MTNFTVGIDLGTTNSLACVFSDGKLHMIPDPHPQAQRTALLPSVVAVSRRAEILAGYDALPYADSENTGVREIKRKMGEQEKIILGDRRLSPQEISAVILQQVSQNIKDITEFEVVEAVVSVPAYFPDASRRATYEAAELAGIKVLRLISEPVAAALAYGFDNPQVDETILVFDFGGGTLDITILELVNRVLDVKISHGDKCLGGLEFDNILRSLAINKFKRMHPTAKISNTTLAHLKRVIVEAKMNLSRRLDTNILFNNVSWTEDGVVNLDVEISRAEYEEVAAPLLDRTRKVILEALEKADLTATEIDKILLVGGTTYMPCVQAILEEIFDKAVVCASLDRDLAVAQGAAIYAAIIKGLIDESIVVSDVAPFGLGINIIRDYGRFEQEVYEPLIRPNEKIPLTIRKDYALRYTDQTDLGITLYQDLTGDENLESAVRTEAAARITDIPHSETGSPHHVEVKFEYDVNGMAKLSASIPDTKQAAYVVYTTVGEKDEKISLSIARQTLQWKTSASVKKHLPIISRAEALLADVNGETKRLLERGLLRVQTAVEEDASVDAAVCQLVDLLFTLGMGG